MQNNNYLSKYLDNLSTYSKIWKTILNLQVPVYVNKYIEGDKQKLLISFDLPELKNEHKYFKLEILSRMATLNIFAENVQIGKKRLVISINKENANKFDTLIDNAIHFKKPDGKIRED